MTTSAPSSSPTQPEDETGTGHVTTGPAGVELTLATKAGAWVRVHGRRDPRTEARAWLERTLGGAPSPSVVAVLGVGLGFIVDEALERWPDARVVALELEPAFAKAFRARRDWQPELGSGRLVYAVDPQFATKPPSWPPSVQADAPLVLVHPVIGEHRPDALARAHRALQQLLFEQRANREAAREFGALYLENSIANLRAFETEGDVRALAGLAEGLPVVVCAPGPSLDWLLPELRAYRDRAVLLALDTALRPLLAAGIEPDLVVGVDPTALNGRHLVNLPRHRSVHLVAEASLHPQGLRAFEGRTFLFRVGRNHPWPWLLEGGLDRGTVNVWGSVLTAGCDVAVLAGGDPVIFAGTDLGYTRGQPYCRGTTFEADWAAQQQRDGLSLPEVWARRLPARIVEEPDVSGRPARTSPHLVAFRNWLRTFVDGHADRRFVNATRAGILHGKGIAQRSLPEELGMRAPIGSCDARLRTAHRASLDRSLATRCVLGALLASKPGRPPWSEWIGASLAFDEERLRRHAGLNLAHLDARPAPHCRSEEDDMTALPEWVNVPHDPAHYWAKPPLEWKVSQEGQLTLAYWLAGKTMTLSFKVTRSSLSGEPANELYLRIPGGYLPARSMASAVWIGGVAHKEMGYATVHPGLDAVVIFRASEADFALDGESAAVFGQMTFEVE